LLAKNYHHHTELVALLPAGKSPLLPHCKSGASQGSCSSACERLTRQIRLVPETERLTRAEGADDGKTTPHAYGVDDDAGPLFAPRQIVF
jgi:hypothetical protein